MKSNFIVYPYRWVVLAAYFLITMAVEIQWLTFAPIARAAEFHYAGQKPALSLINIDFLSMIYMFVFLILCLPASYVIDTYGIKKGIALGSLIAGFSAMGERGTAAGISALAQYLGIILVMLLFYGIFTFAAGLAAAVMIKEEPPTPPAEMKLERQNVIEGLRHILKLKDMRLLLILFFIGLGLFNAVSTAIDSLCASKGLTMDQSGLTGGIMLFGGILGALIIPIFFDKLRKRKIFLQLCMAGMIPSVAALFMTGLLKESPMIIKEAEKYAE